MSNQAILAPNIDRQSAFDGSVSILLNGRFNSNVSPYLCAMQGPADALAAYLNSEYADLLIVKQVSMWPIWNQDSGPSANSPFKQSGKVPGYIITTPDGRTLLDYTVAANLLVEYFVPGYFDHYIRATYAPGGTVYQPGNLAWAQLQAGETAQQAIQDWLNSGGPA